MNLTREKSNMLAILSMALCVMVASACWMMMRFGSLISFFDFETTEYMDWVLYAYIICDIAMIPVGGILSDHYGEKKVFASGVIVFLAGTILCILANSFVMMSWFRGIMGAGAGLIIGTSFAAPGTIGGRYFRGLSFGQELMAGAFAIGSLFGAATGYFLMNHVSDWRQMYLFMAVFMVIGAVLACVTLPNKVKDTSRRLDIPGLVLIVAIFFAIAATVEVVSVYFFYDNPWTLILIPFIISMIVALYYREKVAEFPAIPRGISAGVILQMVVLVLVSVFVIGLLQLYLKIYLIEYEFDIYKASILFLCMLIGAMCTSIPGGHMVGRTGSKPILIFGSILMIIALALTYNFITSGVAYLHAIMMILGAGLGCIVTVIICSIQFNTPVKDRGAVTGIAVAARMLGIIGGLAGVTNYTALNIDTFLEGLIGQQMSGTMDIVEILMAILAVLIQTGVDVTDTVIGLYVDSFCDWAIGSILVLILVIVICIVGYGVKDSVPPEVVHAECAGYEPPVIRNTREPQAGSEDVAENEQ